MNVTVRELRKNLAQHLNSNEDVVILKWGKPIAVLKKPQKMTATVDGKVIPVKQPKVELAHPPEKEKIVKLKPETKNQYMCKHGFPRHLCQYKGNKAKCEE